MHVRDQIWNKLNGKRKRKERNKGLESTNSFINVIWNFELRTKPLRTWFLFVNQLHFLLDKGIGRWQLFWQRFYPTYTPVTLSKNENIDNHRLLLSTVRHSTKQEELDLPSLNSKLHKCRQTSLQVTDSYFISSKNGLQSYCETTYSRGSLNRMWILKNTKDLLECRKSMFLFILR